MNFHVPAAEEHDLTVNRERYAAMLANLRSLYSRLRSDGAHDHADLLRAALASGGEAIHPAGSPAHQQYATALTDFINGE